MGYISKVAVLVAAVFVALLLASACSVNDSRKNGTVGFEEATVGGSIALPETTTGTTETTGGLGTTRNTTSGTLPVTLRVEGDRRTTFSGVCSSGGEDTVIRGMVPKRFTYDLPKGRKLDCRIQKQDSKKGSLRVILIANNATRSVQQTNNKGGTINVSYSGT